MVEWFAIIFAVSFFGLDFNHPISAFPHDHPHTAWFYSISVSLIAILFTIFCLALRRYWKPSFKIAIASGLMFIIVAWAQYNPNGGFWSGVHDLSANIGTLGYGLILFEVCFRGSHVMRRAGMVFSSFAIVNMIAVFLSVHVFRSYATWFQLLFILTVQAWALYIAFYLWTEGKEPIIQ